MTAFHLMSMRHCCYSSFLKLRFLGYRASEPRLVCKINLNLNMKIIIVMLHGRHRNWGVLLCEMNSPGVRLVFNLLF